MYKKVPNLTTRDNEYTTFHLLMKKLLLANLLLFFIELQGIDNYNSSHPFSTSAFTAGTPFSTWLIAEAKAHIVALSLTSGM